MQTTATPEQPVVAPAAKTLPISIVIFSRNDAACISGCIRSCSWSDDIHVVDAGSTDNTCELASDSEVTVHRPGLTNSVQQRNWVIDQRIARNEWQFHLEADERITPQLVQELVSVIAAEEEKTDRAAYLCWRKTIFMGRWMRHCGRAGDEIRLIHSQRCRFSQDGTPLFKGGVGKLEEPFLHISDAHSMLRWFHKCNEFTSRAIGDTDTSGLKNLLSDADAGPVSLFFKNYIGRGGWLDGWRGFHYCRMLSGYQYWIQLKRMEKQLQWPEATSALARKLSGEER